MKKMILCIILFGFFCSFQLFAQQFPKITIVNNTGYPIQELYFESADKNWDDWSLRCWAINTEEILENGKSIEITFPLPLSVTGKFIVTIFDTDDDAYEKSDVQLTENTRIVFTFDDIVF